ncbi:hypothetical protein GQ53DRAFT_742008 [Thozetella sp. PMI_491]|nr:hypothetical protein GQ53DRAFT_742008 [Thozetella sp. PMI_491]
MRHFIDLPQELFEAVTGNLGLADRLRLSSINSQYRSWLAPTLFDSIRITSDNRICSSALLAVRKYGKYTTSLEFIGSVSSGDEDKNLATPVLSSAAAELLGGKHTPRLRTVKVKFDFDFANGDMWDENEHGSCEGYDINAFEVLESPDYVASQEPKREWRALMTETWAALAANQPIKELIVEEFVPKSTTAFGTVEFHQFLSRLESMEISILGLDNGVGWEINTMEGYLDFLSGLWEVFFQHTTNLKHLFLKSAPSSPLGLTGYHHGPLPLRPEDMPVLESLRLQNCFMGPELVSFISKHAAVLKSLELKDCFCSIGYPADDSAIPWGEFFKTIRDAKPGISRLVVDCGKVPLTKEEEYSDCDPNTENEPDEILEIRRALATDANRKLFGYASLDDKYGMVFRQSEQNVTSFNEGDDQKAYDRLMTLVDNNARGLENSA